MSDAMRSTNAWLVEAVILWTTALVIAFTVVCGAWSPMETAARISGAFAAILFAAMGSGFYHARDACRFDACPLDKVMIVVTVLLLCAASFEAITRVAN